MTITPKASVSNPKSKRSAASLKRYSEKQKPKFHERSDVDGSDSILRVSRDRAGNGIAKARTTGA
jgi:hypothetical protein